MRPRNGGWVKYLRRVVNDWSRVEPESRIRRARALTGTALSAALTPASWAINESALTRVGNQNATLGYLPTQPTRKSRVWPKRQASRLLPSEVRGLGVRLAGGRGGDGGVPPSG